MSKPMLSSAAMRVNQFHTLLRDGSTRTKILHISTTSLFVTSFSVRELLVYKICFNFLLLLNSLNYFIVLLFIVLLFNLYFPKFFEIVFFFLEI